MRQQFVNSGQTLPATTSDRAYLAEMDSVLQDMIAAWKRALDLEWGNDG
ncbi:hypothetical protein [Streptomyces sp. NPDC048521]